MATAGRPLKLEFDVYTRVFDYQFHPDPTFEGIATEIFVPPLQYPDAKFEVITSTNVEWRMAEDNPNVLLIFNSLESSPEQVAFVKILPKF